ncbi:PLP-dependent transferase [Terfezia boudieri ATCC MYA-4762]|uniref:PLP-dependent transferase n=1 Tax=Terfezia boudieri ATCC MYA-4762 TaxID=1051890 RepID=A0A3N4LI68_9PEZI|nr:PLP-dependent transferase [Terfezia boudieri ATCC MYA-4762]
MVCLESMLSGRGRKNLIGPNENLKALLEVLANSYHEKTNPDGIINLGIAENTLMHQELCKYMNNSCRLESKHLSYGDTAWGSLRLRMNLAGFVNKYFHPVMEINPGEIIVSSGVSGILDQLAWATCNEGDGVLIGKPVYSGFTFDLASRSKVHDVAVSFGDIDPFSAKALQCYKEQLEAFNRKGEGKIKAVILTNPHNPFGKCYPVETIKALMRFCQEHNLHLISDEIYALSVFKTPYNADAVGFHSVLSVDPTGLIDPNRIHTLYGMSKDFSANGLRLGLIITRNPTLIQAMYSVVPFSWASAPADLIWSTILEDTKFLTYYLDENQRRLGEGYELLTTTLDRYGIKYVKGGNAGFFLWVDLSFALEKPEDGGEPGVMEDKKLNKKIWDGKVYLATTGGFQGEKTGWYRITFAHPKPLLMLGLKRSEGAESCNKTSDGVEIFSVVKIGRVL